MNFQQATKKRAKGRLALIGPPGSGKTYSALTIAQYLGKKIAVIDTEHGSASKYADIFDFDVVELDSFSPQIYAGKIHEAEAAGYDVLVIDSLSHAWAGRDGCLELVDKAAARSKSHNSFAAWREVTPHHNALVEAILSCRCHVFVTMRSKVEYVVEDDGRGRKVPRKVGMAPIQRDGLEYEFDVVGDMDQENTLIVTKSRCPKLTGAVVKKPGREFAEIFADWLSGASTVEENFIPKLEGNNSATRKSNKAHFWAIFRDRYAACNDGRELSNNIKPEVISETIARLCDSGPAAQVANETGHTPFWSRDGGARMDDNDPGWETLIIAIQDIDVKEILTQAREALKKRSDCHAI